MKKATMKATTLARLIEECDNHALTDYYYFQKIEPYSLNRKISTNPDIELEKGMYLVFYTNNFIGEFKSILNRMFGNTLDNYISYQDEKTIIIRIQD